jgi:phage FluMu protein Com
MQSISCAECLRAMARGRSELLVRIACANCQQALEDLAQAARTLPELSSRTVLGVRCMQCGKWCLTRNSLATHRRSHVIGPFR